LKIAFFYSSNVFHESRDQRWEWTSQHKMLRISQRLADRGHDVYWLMPSANPQNSRTADDIQIVTFDYPKIAILSTFLYFIRVWVFLLSRRLNCVFVHCWFFYRANLLYALVFQIGVKILGPKFIYLTGDLPVEFEIAAGRMNQGSFKEKYMRALSHITHFFSDVIIVISEESRDHLVKTGIPGEKISVAVLGPDESYSNLPVIGNAIREKLRIADRFVIGWFGNMSSYRRIDEILLPLMENLSEDIPNVYFLVGGAGRMLTQILSFRKKKPKAPFQYLGYIPYSCLPSYLAAIDVQISPLDSRFEHCQIALSFKTIDALAVGRPSIVTATKAHIRHFSRFSSVILAEDSYESFRSSLINVRLNCEHYKSLAERDAKMMNQYLLNPNIDKIVQIIESFRQ
jgi:glycosyltransferase involved in cell wall biosynthesis